MNRSRFMTYISEQGKVWKEMYDRKEEITKDFVKLYNAFQPERIICIGSGSSNHACMMAKEVMDNCLGIEVTYVTPCEFPNLRNIKEKKLLYIAVSQSGISTNTYEIITELLKNGEKVVAVTSSDKSPIGSIASVNVPLLIGEENIGAKTKGMTASALTLMYIALSVTQNNEYKERIYSELKSLYENIESVEKKMLTFADSNSKELIKYPTMTILSDNQHAGSAKETSLKILETSYIPTYFFLFDEYIHGPQCCLDEKSFVVIFVPDKGQDSTRAYTLADFIRSKGGRCVLIGSKLKKGLDTVEIYNVESEELQGLSYLVAMQVMTGVLFDARGIDVNIPVFKDFTKMIGSKILTDTSVQFEKTLA